MRIVQFFVDHNLRGGERQLTIDVEGRNKYLPKGDFFFFLNKKRNIIKVLAHTGVYTQHWPDKETFDYKLRMKELLKRVGIFFGLELIPSPEAISKLEKIIKEKSGKDTKKKL